MRALLQRDRIFRKEGGVRSAATGLLLITVATLPLGARLAGAQQTAPPTAGGQQPTPAPAPATLEKRLAALEATVANQGKQLAAAQDALAKETAVRTALQEALAKETAARAALEAKVDSAARAQAALESQLKPAAEKLAPISRAGNELVISGVNVRIVNGAGSTEAVNGLGNLIVGYNESRGFYAPPDNRTGSHNIVVGKWNNYASCGGLVAGLFNEVSGRYASVTGGTVNTASGEAATVSGGSGKTARESHAWVGGG
jgi:hypothetical protein